MYRGLALLGILIALFTAALTPVKADHTTIDAYTPAGRYGGGVVTRGGPIEVTIEPSTSDFVNELWLVAPGRPRLIGLDNETGKIVHIAPPIPLRDPWPPGIPIVFERRAPTGWNSRSGEGTNNPPDGRTHVLITNRPGGVAVRFEDAPPSGDPPNFRDGVLAVKGVKWAPGAPRTCVVDFLASGLVASPRTVFEKTLALGRNSTLTMTRAPLTVKATYEINDYSTGRTLAEGSIVSGPWPFREAEVEITLRGVRADDARTVKLVVTAAMDQPDHFVYLRLSSNVCNLAPPPSTSTTTNSTTTTSSTTIPGPVIL